jgi:pilus assembly protein CpaB
MKSLILIFIALGCGLVASIGISQVMDRSGSRAPAMEMEQILVAATDIDNNAKLDAKNLKLEDWPKLKIPEGAIRKLPDAVDKYTISRFYAGEPVLAAKISDEPGGVTEFIPEGYRAMPVKIEEDTVMKGISPGDRVDVLVFLRRNGDEIPETGAFPILRNVRVFATNSNTERVVDSKGTEASFRTVSLLIKEAHVGELAIAAQMGKILLTLRRPNEKDDQIGEEVTPMSEILAGKSKIDAPEVAAPAPSTGFRDMLQNAAGQNGAGQGAAAEPPAVVASEWKMQLAGPDGIRQFDWPDRDGLPVESLLVSAGSGTGSGSTGTLPAVNQPPTTNETAVEPTLPEPATEPEGSLDD